jgi:hypothetical protein
MSQYYAQRSAAPSFSPNEAPVEPDSENTGEQSEFDKHRETLLSDDVEEGWASELRRYLGTTHRAVKKDVDLVEWWQVSILNTFAQAYALTPACRIMLSHFRPSRV